MSAALPRNLPVVPRITFGEGAIDNLAKVVGTRSKNGADVVYIVDPGLSSSTVEEILEFAPNGREIRPDLSTEPRTEQIDEIVRSLQSQGASPAAIVGIGGGSAMDIAKAVSLLLTNPGGAADYQGWDLVKTPGLFHVGIPTLAGSGAEVSRTAVLIGPEKKLGINSDYTPFDQIILDPSLIASAPVEQAFYTAMDCYIHCAESLHGTLNNVFSTAYAEKAKELCEEVYLGKPANAGEKMMMASYMGGLSIGYSQVGICHALSYGLSYGIGTRHALANCVIFDKLEDYFPAEVKTFRKMAQLAGANIPNSVCAGVSEETRSKMVTVAYGMAPLWQNTFGLKWQETVTRDFIERFYDRL